LKIRV